jgi:hypothetical protein
MLDDLSASTAKAATEATASSPAPKPPALDEEAELPPVDEADKDAQ